MALLDRWWVVHFTSYLFWLARFPMFFLYRPVLFCLRLGYQRTQWFVPTALPLSQPQQQTGVCRCVCPCVGVYVCVCVSFVLWSVFFIFGLLLFVWNGRGKRRWVRLRSSCMCVCVCDVYGEACLVHASARQNCSMVVSIVHHDRRWWEWYNELHGYVCRCYQLLCLWCVWIRDVNDLFRSFPILTSLLHFLLIRVCSRWGMRFHSVIIHTR